MKGKCCLLALLAALPLGAQEITDACQERAEALVREMTLEEKIAFVGGSRDGFHLGPVRRLGIPESRLPRNRPIAPGATNTPRPAPFICSLRSA